MERLGEGTCGHPSPEGALVDADKAAHLSCVKELSRGRGLGAFNEIIQGVEERLQSKFELLGQELPQAIFLDG